MRLRRQSRHSNDMISALASRRDGLGGRAQEQAHDVGGGAGVAEEIALHLGAADRCQLIELLLGLHSLRGRHHVEALGEAGDGVTQPVLIAELEAAASAQAAADAVPAADGESDASITVRE